MMHVRRRSVLMVVLAVAGALTPLVAHAIGGRCWVFLPAHVPPLLAGLALGPIAGLIAGVATALSDLLWGGRLEVMMFLPVGVELLVYGAVAGLAASRAQSRGGLFLALLAAMVLGRLAHFCAALPLDRSPEYLVGALFVRPWPGTLFQLVALPLVAPLVSRAVAAQPAAAANVAPAPQTRGQIARRWYLWSSLVLALIVGIGGAALLSQVDGRDMGPAIFAGVWLIALAIAGGNLLVSLGVWLLGRRRAVRETV